MLRTKYKHLTAKSVEKGQPPLFNYETFIVPDMKTCPRRFYKMTKMSVKRFEELTEALADQEQQAKGARMDAYEGKVFYILK